MDIITISVQQLEALLDLKVKVILDAITPEKNKIYSDQWFDLQGLIEYLPSKPKPQTIYDWVHKKIIPHHKSPDTKMLTFLKSEIDDWLKTGRRKTQSENEELVKKYLTKKNKHESKNM
jgi:hypothetical protein